MQDYGIGAKGAVEESSEVGQGWEGEGLLDEQVVFRACYAVDLVPFDPYLDGED